MPVIVKNAEEKSITTENERSLKKLK